MEEETLNEITAMAEILKEQTDRLERILTELFSDPENRDQRKKSSR